MINLRINACSPSFGIVSPGAIEVAREKERLNVKQIKNLVESQDNNFKYHVIDTIDYDGRRCYAVAKGTILERFRSFAAACTFATVVEKTARECKSIND